MRDKTDSDQLDAILEQIGLSVGLLSQNGPHLELNEAWFQNPWGKDGQNITGLARRPDLLVPLLAHLLGPSRSVPHSLQDQHHAWHPVGSTGVYLTLSNPSQSIHAPSVTLGVGFQTSVRNRTGWLYCPLYRLETHQNARLIFGKTDGVAQLGLELNNADSQDAYPQNAHPIGLVSDLTGNTRLYGEEDAIKDALLTLKEVPLRTGAQITWGQLLDNLGHDATNLQVQKSAIDPSITASQILSVLNDFINLEDGLIAPIGNGGLYVYQQELAEDITTFGLRLQLPDVGVTPPEEETEANTAQAATLKTTPQKEVDETTSEETPKTSKFTLQIGKWLSGEDDFDASWLSRSQGNLSIAQDPGLILTLIQQDLSVSPATVDFHFGVDAVSIGFDYLGSAAEPLIQIAGFSLVGLELRGYVAGDYDDTLSWTVGGGTLLDHIALPLGPSFADQSEPTDAKTSSDTAQGSNTSAGTNVAVTDTLSSGTGEGGNAATGEADAVAPPFSMSIGYMSGGTFSLQLLDEDGEETETVWLPMQRTYGPVFIRQLGLGWSQDDMQLSFIVDGGVTTDVLTIELINLGVEIPITTPLDLTHYGLRLDGFDFDFDAGPIELSGGLLQNQAMDPTDYEGHALIKAWRLAISAMGAYSTADGSPSLFVFAMLNMPLGGIPAMFVNGLSAGFGYNRALKLPNVDQVNEFPLVAGLNDEEVLGDSCQSALGALGDWVYPSRGQYWMAGGIKWTNYEVLNTNALLEVQFGNEFEIGVIGLSVVSLPQNTDKKFAYAELGLELILDIGQGEFVASAVLSSNSFLIDQNFTLTGGFAMCAWWGDSVESGDFVTSLGGYHPAVIVPDYYPNLDRLGFSAGIGDFISIYGDLYFALTTSNIMAGGSLQFQYDMAGFRVWFGGEADLILYWQPFYFDAHMDVSAGAEYTASVFGVQATMRLTAGGMVDLWSPETGGRIEIDFWFLSFPIKFGAEEMTDGTLPVDWDGFKPMLPQEQVVASEADTQHGTAETQKRSAPASKAQTQSYAAAQTSTDVTDTSVANPDDTVAFVQINVTSGLLGMLPALDNPDETAWLVRSALFGFSTSTPLPVTTLAFTNAGAEPLTIAQTDAALGILPMNAAISDTTHQITITNLDTGDVFPASDWQVTPQRLQMPKAIWGQRAQLSKTPELIPECLTGAQQVTHAPHDALSGPPAFSMVEAFQYITISDSDEKALLPLNPSVVPPECGSAVMDPSALKAVRDVENKANARTDVFNALTAIGALAGVDGDLAHLAADPSGTLRAAPRLGTLQTLA